jgi:hypothetical protein
MAEPRAAAEEQGAAFLDLLLGLVSLSERLLAATGGLATGEPPRKDHEPDPPAAPPAGPVLR